MFFYIIWTYKYVVNIEDADFCPTPLKIVPLIFGIRWRISHPKGNTWNSYNPMNVLKAVLALLASSISISNSLYRGQELRRF